MLFRRSSHHYLSRRRSEPDTNFLIGDVAFREVLSLYLQFCPSFCMVYIDLSLLSSRFHSLSIFVVCSSSDLCCFGRTISLLSILSSFLSNKTINGAYSSAGYLISELKFRFFAFVFNRFCLKLLIVL